MRPRVARTTASVEQAVTASKGAALLKLVFSTRIQTPTRSYWLGDGTRYIGRAPETDLHGAILLADDPCVSRTHATVTVLGDDVTVRDEGSRHGTWLNGLRIQEERLHDGDLLRTGESIFVFRRNVDRDQVMRQSPDGMVVESPAMHRVLALADVIARGEDPILLLGETGTGKEILCRYIHSQSGRGGPLVSVNCATLTSELADSSLFGHRQGAYTGASRTHEGFFAAAGKGTLFLDELGELSLPVQAKLLRALSERVVTPVGSTAARPYQARIIAATNRDVDTAERTGTFRPDLLARLDSFRLTLPPLRERRDDVLLLLFPYLPRHSRLSGRLAEALLLHSWPHNIRDVQKLGRFLQSHCSEDALLDVFHVEPVLRLPPPSAQTKGRGAWSSTTGPLPERSDAGPEPPISRTALESLLRKHAGVVARVAAEVLRSPRQVRRWMDHYKLERSACLPK